MIARAAALVFWLAKMFTLPIFFALLGPVLFVEIIARPWEPEKFCSVVDGYVIWAFTPPEVLIRESR